MSDIVNKRGWNPYIKQEDEDKNKKEIEKEDEEEDEGDDHK